MSLLPTAVLARHRLALLVAALVLMLSSAAPVFAQDDATPAVPADNSQSAPAETGAGVPGTYFGPVPSSVQRELIGPFQLLKSGPVDTANSTVTLPLYLGHMPDGTNVWYILTDTNDKGNADALGLNYSAKLGYAGTGQAVRNATLGTDAKLTFESGTVDFSPELAVKPGEGDNAFPPSVATPGSVGDDAYTPLVRLTNAGDAIYNAPIVAFGTDADQLNFCGGSPNYSIVHDDVLSFCPSEGTVTLALTKGFSFGRPVLYLSTDANVESVAALESATLAPALSDVQVGTDDGAFSAVERIFIATNGPTGADNPQRQGLNSAIVDGDGPLNVLGGIPTVATDYSPIWDANIYSWTQEAIDSGYRARNIQEFEILGLANLGWITGPNGAPFGSSGIVINCPIVMRLL
jgi:hypothetical protein